MHYVDAAFLDGANIEGVGVQKLNDEYPKDILVTEIVGSGNPRQTAKQITEGGNAGFGRMIRGKQLK